MEVGEFSPGKPFLFQRDLERWKRVVGFGKEGPTENGGQGAT